MGVAAIDTYLHWAVRNTPLDNLPARLAKVEITFGELLGMADQSVEARQKQIRDRPRVRARNILNEKLVTLTFQSSRQVEDALEMAGVKAIWLSIENAFTPHEAPSAIKARLNQIAYRRNRIVHEGDLRRLVRPQRVTREPIERAAVDDDLAWIQRFINALAAVRP